MFTSEDAVRKEFIQLAQSNFTGFPNLLKMAKVVYTSVVTRWNIFIYMYCTVTY